MTLAAALFDVVLPVAIATAAAAWLARRAWRSMRGKGAGCGCPSSSAGEGCARVGEMKGALRAAAKRGAEAERVP